MYATFEAGALRRTKSHTSKGSSKIAVDDAWNHRGAGFGMSGSKLLGVVRYVVCDVMCGVVWCGVV